MHKHSCLNLLLFKLLLGLCLLFFPSILLAQSCTIYQQYAKTYAADGLSNQYFLLQLADNSLIVGGHVNKKLFMIKANAKGNRVWSKL